MARITAETFLERLLTLWWRWTLSLLAMAVIVLALDQYTKALAAQYLDSQIGLNIIGDYLRLVLVTNTGAAFGLFQGKTTVLAIVAILAIPLILYLGQNLRESWWIVRLSPGLLLGGAIGNLVDRIRLGYVIDFIDVGIGSLRWPSFNIADSSFVIGTVILAAYVLLGSERQKQQNGTPGSPSSV